MSYKTEFQSNNADLQTILATVYTLPDRGNVEESTFIPTDSGSNKYKNKFQDNNIDLQRILDVVNALPDKVTIPVTISGSGRSRISSVVVNGMEYTGATSDIKVSPGDIVTFWVGGITASYYGSVTIDGVSVLTTDDYGSYKYEWSVPDDVKTISVNLGCTYVEQIYDDYYGRVAVSTT